MAGIPENIIDQVRDKTDITEVIGRYIPLKRAGRNFKAPCPFHNEKTPSFMVSPAKQIFHCFGCGAGGNVFNFIMKYERLQFPEAVRSLAERAGINIPEPSQASSEAASLAQKLHQVNELAASFYQDNLLKTEYGKMSREYMQNRGINRDVIEKFKLGYALKAWDGFINFAKRKGLTTAILEKTGLVLKKNNTSMYDRFRDRLIFPILDIKGKVKGFGGRVLNEGMPKYMNSPETHIYNKGSHLYGLNLAWEDIRRSDEAVVVEGYLDLLTPYQHGSRNIVASLGTALTVDQIRLLKRFTNNIVTLFDADQAGEQATLRSLDLIIQEDMRVRVAELPSGADPDSFIRKYGKERFESAITNAQDLFDYKLKLLASKFNPKSTEGKAKIAEEMLPTIYKIKNAILKSEYMKKLAESLAIDREALKTELAKVKPDYSYRYKVDKKLEPVHSKKVIRHAERILAGLMIEDGSAISMVKENLEESDFKNDFVKKIVNALFTLHTEKRVVNPSKLISFFGNEEIGSYISELIANSENLVDKEKNLEDCIQWIKRDNLKVKLDSMQSQIKTAQDSGNYEEAVELVTRYNQLINNPIT